MKQEYYSKAVKKARLAIMTDNSRTISIMVKVS